LKLFTFSLLFFTMIFSAAVFAADTGTVSALNQVNASIWRIDPNQMSGTSDPHPETIVPETMIGTMADTQFGRNVPSGFNQVNLLDQTVSSRVGDFQSVVNRMNSTPSNTGRINQLQTQINQKQLQASYIFDEKFGITSVTDGSGNLVGQALGTYIGTMTEYDGKKVVTVTCRGTFTYDLTDGYTQTSGPPSTGLLTGQIWKGSGCNAQ